jgi:uncharacterized protein (TIGR03083 family)
VVFNIGKSAMDGNLRIPEPIIVTHLFGEERTALLDVLGSLTDEEWRRPTVCAGWSVHDVAVHLLGGYAGNLSRRRDRFANAELPPGDDLVERLDVYNEVWVEAARRLSPPILIQMLALLGDQLDAYFESVDAFETGGEVMWAGDGPAPVWLDLAREYTEHWHHQQHIRDATDRPILDEPRLMHPVLAAFAFALPKTFADIETPGGTSFTLTVTGPAGGDWTIVDQNGWRLFEGRPPVSDARVVLPQDVVWRLFTKGISPAAAREAASIEGDQRLASHLFNAVAIIA